jgi:hypothetical protein
MVKVILQTGYEVFDRQEIQREHVKVSHEPVETWADRPGTTGGLGRSKEGPLRNSRKMPTITKT